MKKHNNSNIVIEYDGDTVTYELIPYNRVLDIDNIARWVKRMIHHNRILRKDNVVILLPNGYNIDGLRETNTMLPNQKLYNEYYGTYRTIN